MKDFNIPLLTAEDIDCRVQSVSKAKNGTVGAVLLLYKDARVDMRILDQVFGPGNWQRTHELINGNLFCTIEIWDDEKAAWVKKQDVGVESNTEKEKGQASDAFKRAGFNVGIGRELYSAPFTYVELNDGEWKVEKVQGRDVYRTYDQVISLGTRKHTLPPAELWWTGGVKYFKTDAFAGTIAGDFIVDTEHGDEANDYTEPHFTVGDKAYNWDAVPIVWLKYNEEELPLCYFIKDLIDDINWQTSVTADVLRDVAKFIYILKNYGGQDLGEFIKDLKEHMAIKVTTDGGVDKLQADLNIDAVMAFLDKQRRDVYDFAAAVDTKDPDLGNASGTAINFRYMDLSSDCDSLATELKDTFQRLKLFIDVYLQIAGKGDFSKETFDIVFNMDLPVNETDVIQNAVASESLLSKRTILQNHPWVTDADEEMERIDAEKKAAMEEYGEGLLGDPVNGGGADGDE